MIFFRVLWKKNKIRLQMTFQRVLWGGGTKIDERVDLNISKDTSFHITILSCSEGYLKLYSKNRGLKLGFILIGFNNTFLIDYLC